MVSNGHGTLFHEIQPKHSLSPFLDVNSANNKQFETIQQMSESKILKCFHETE